MGNGLIFPYHSKNVCTDGVTQKGGQACDWRCRFKHVGGSGRQIRRTITLRCDDELSFERSC
jgi:hypothetical protein